MDLRRGDVMLRSGTYVKVSVSVPPFSEGAVAAGLWRIVGFVWQDSKWRPVELRWILNGAETIPVLHPDYALAMFGGDSDDSD
jgi:hypothetical protein